MTYPKLIPVKKNNFIYQVHNMLLKLFFMISSFFHFSLLSSLSVVHVYHQVMVEISRILASSCEHFPINLAAKRLWSLWVRHWHPNLQECYPHPIKCPTSTHCDWLVILISVMGELYKNDEQPRPVLYKSEINRKGFFLDDFLRGLDTCGEKPKRPKVLRPSWWRGLFWGTGEKKRRYL